MSSTTESLRTESKEAIDRLAEECADLEAQLSAAVKRAEEAEKAVEKVEEARDKQKEHIEALESAAKENAQDLDDYNRAADTLRNFEDTLKPVVYREKLPLWERVETVCTDLTASRKAYADLEAAIVPELERLEKLAALLKDIAAEDFGKIKNARLQALIADARKTLGE